MDDDVVPHFTSYVRKLDGGGISITAYKDRLWNSEGVGIINQWNCEGKCIRRLESKTNYTISSLLAWKDCICSAYMDNTIRVWDIITGKLVRELEVHTDEIGALTEWRNCIISSIESDIVVWNDNGESVHRWDTESTVWSLAVWKDSLCSGHYNGIIRVWSDYGKCSLELRRQAVIVTCIVVHENFLYSGSADWSICKWNMEGQFIADMNFHTDWVQCLVVYRGHLYSGSYDNTIVKWTLDGKPLQVLYGHSDSSCVHCLTIWNDTLVSGGRNEMIQWTGDTFSTELNLLL